MNNILMQLQIDPQQWQDALDSEERIERIVASSGKVYWLKKSAPARGVLRYYALNLFSKLLRVPLLKAVPQKGGQVALDLEVLRIKQLQKYNILVPELIAKQPGWILLADLGKSIIDEFKQNRQDTLRVQKLFSNCIEAIKQLHQQNQYMSQGFARNMLKVSDNPVRIGFIDFEDDPLSVMDLNQAQARDLILFINSTARFFVKDREFFQQQIYKFLDGHKPAVIRNIEKTNNSLLWITKVPFQNALGHDYQKLKVGILALQQMCDRTKPFTH